MSDRSDPIERAATVAVYPGSFDPITCGHVEIIERSARLFDRVIVAVGQHPSKTGYFSVQERVKLVQASIEHIPNTSADHFDGLVVEFCRKNQARVLIRGLRATGDFEQEFQMGLANRDLAPEIETVFLIPRPEQQFISSSLIREISSFGGDFQRYVPPAVAEAMNQRAKQERRE